MLVFPKKDRIYSIDTLEQEAGKLSDILVSFRPFMNVNHFETLKQEITQFNEEYISGHYTTAALRVGRTLEHVIYTLAQALNVDVNKKTLKILDDIDNSFNQIRKHFINFSNIEQNKRSGKKKNLIKNITNMTAKLVSLATEIDNEHEEKIAGIVNTESILRDIKAKFDHIKEIRDELRELENSNLIKKITDKRNEAAHANLSGEVTEFTKNDIDEIIETLRTILFRLVNIHQIYLNLPSKPQK